MPPRPDGAALATAGPLLGVSRLGFPGQLLGADLTVALPG
ncbi:hypothetical protein GCM10010421_14980 [Streptomyces glaucus]|uniref:Secreted protein n=1 Tax=Streptomyces glaucus TaxID=284029 RepID=A0ABN3JH95_9ACTN